MALWCVAFPCPLCKEVPASDDIMCHLRQGGFNTLIDWRSHLELASVYVCLGRALFVEKQY